MYIYLIGVSDLGTKKFNKPIVGRSLLYFDN